MADPDTPTVLSRALAASIPEDRARQRLAEGRVWLDGEVVTDPDTLAPPPARIIYNAG